MVDLYPVRALGIDPKSGSVVSNGKNYAVNCTQCTARGERTPDTKHRLHICVERSSSRFGFYQCFRCGWKGKVGRQTQLDTSFLTLKRRRQVKELMEKEKQADAPAEPQGVALPEGFRRLHPRLHAYQYLLKRGITPEDIAYYGIGLATQHRVENHPDSRIIFPDTDIEEKLCYWVGRSYDGREPKYSNAPGVDRAHQIYNYGRVYKAGFKVVTINEGVISSIVAGRDALATYGKQVTQGQVEMLRALKLKAVYLVAEPDARKQTLKLAKELEPGVGKVYLVPLPKGPGQDPAEMGRESFASFRRERRMLYSRSAKDVPVRFLLSD